VDLERHRVVDLLPERSADSFADWLMNNPTVNVISRDRSGLYAQGAAVGAPSAQQVADRFHLVVNLSAAIERALEERSSELQLAAAEIDNQPEHGTENKRPQLTQQQKLQLQRRQRRMGQARAGRNARSHRSSTIVAVTAPDSTGNRQEPLAVVRALNRVA
jgi:transposase